MLTLFKCKYNIVFIKKSDNIIFLHYVRFLEKNLKLNFFFHLRILDATVKKTSERYIAFYLI